MVEQAPAGVLILSRGSGAEVSNYGALKPHAPWSVIYIAQDRYVIFTGEIFTRVYKLSTFFCQWTPTYIIHLRFTQVSPDMLQSHTFQGRYHKSACSLHDAFSPASWSHRSLCSVLVIHLYLSSVGIGVTVTPIPVLCLSPPLSGPVSP